MKIKIILISVLMFVQSVTYAGSAEIVLAKTLKMKFDQELELWNERYNTNLSFTYMHSENGFISAIGIHDESQGGKLINYIKIETDDKQLPVAIRNQQGQRIDLSQEINVIQKSAKSHFNNNDSNRVNVHVNSKRFINSVRPQLNKINEKIHLILSSTLITKSKTEKARSVAQQDETEETDRTAFFVTFMVMIIGGTILSFVLIFTSLSLLVIFAIMGAFLGITSGIGYYFHNKANEQ